MKRKNARRKQWSAYLNHLYNLRWSSPPANSATLTVPRAWLRLGGHKDRVKDMDYLRRRGRRTPTS